MPKTNESGRYTIDTNKRETVRLIEMPHYVNEVAALFDHHMKTTLKGGVQHKLF